MDLRHTPDTVGQRSTSLSDLHISARPCLEDKQAAEEVVKVVKVVQVGSTEAVTVGAAGDMAGDSCVCVCADRVCE